MFVCNGLKVAWTGTTTIAFSNARDSSNTKGSMGIKNQQKAHTAMRKRFDDAECRIEQILYLAGMVCTYGGWQGIEDFVHVMRDDVQSRERIFGKTTAALQKILDGNDHGKIFTWLLGQGKLGFLVRFASPVIFKGKNPFGCYTTLWVYGETLEEAVENGFKWVASMREKKR